MAFNVTYGNLLSSNIKHLYTTREKTMHQKVPRQKFYRPEFLELEQQAKDRHRKRRARRVPNMEFMPEYNIDIPRAPAFRKADPEYVNEMVNRLSRRPKIKSDPRGCCKYQRDFMEYDWEEDQGSYREPVSSRRMNSILNRLTTKHVVCGKRHPSPDLREDDYLPNIKI